MRVPYSHFDQKTKDLKKEILKKIFISGLLMLYLYRDD